MFWNVVQKPYKQCIPGTSPCGETRDAQLEYPLVAERVTSFESALYSFLPWVLLLIPNIIFFYIQSKKKKKNETLKAETKPNHISDMKYIFIVLELLLRCLSFCCGLCLCLTKLTKIYVGRPRPNFYQQTNNNTDHSIHNAFESFPSGHSSISSSSLFLLSLFLWNSIYYVQKRIQLKRFYKLLKKSSNGNNTFYYGFDCIPINIHSWFLLALWIKLHNHLSLCLILSLIPGIIFFYVGISRILDYQHHYVDVVSGWLLGIMCALLSFIMYYPKFEYYINVMFVCQANYSDDEKINQIKNINCNLNQTMMHNNNTNREIKMVESSSNLNVNNNYNDNSSSNNNNYNNYTSKQSMQMKIETEMTSN